jgi:Ca2+-binding RTX toxin-like protein
MANFNGAAGDDVYVGGIDSDTIIGNGGNDTLSGDAGADVIAGGAGEDVISGGDGADKLYSGDESPPFERPYYGNAYTPPLMDTGAAVDTLIGGAGDDSLFAGYGDNVDGGTSDAFGDNLYISFLGASVGVTADFSTATQVIGGGTIKNIENVNWIQGSNFDDTITDGPNGGYSTFTIIEGMGGNDQITANYYTGNIWGGDGNDVIDGRPSQYLQSVRGGAGNDILFTNSNTFAAAYGDDGDDIIYSHGTTYGGAGNDLIAIQWSYYSGQVYGEAGDDDIRAAAGDALSAAGGAGADLITGDSGDDVLYSGDLGEIGQGPADDMGAEHDVIVAKSGHDTLAAGYGDDVDGGADNDTLRLSLGGAASGVVFSTADFVSGQPFTFGGGTIQNVETLVSLRGSEFGDHLTLVAQATSLTVDAGAGDDVITSSSSQVFLSGGEGDDRFVSGGAADTFDGGAGNDTIDYHANVAGVTVDLVTGSGAGGDTLTHVESVIATAFADTILVDDGQTANVLDGGAGVDTVSYAAAQSGVTVALGLAGAQQTFGSGFDTLIGIENLIGSQFSDTLTGDAAANALTGNTGNDVFAGRGGVDVLSGGAGTDTASYLSAAGGIVANLAALLVSNDGDGGSDTLSSIENIIGSAYADAIWGDGGVNVLRGEGGDDQLQGGGGADTLIGGAGADLMVGGAGDDGYEVTEAGDAVVEAAGEGTDTVYSYLARYDLGANVETLVLGGSAQIGVGNALANTLIGNGLGNLLAGGAGNDTLIGGAGDDVYEVTETGDLVVEVAGEGADTVYSYIGRFDMTANVETLVLAGSAQIGIGNALANTLIGNGLGNLLAGGAGADLMIGGAGDDAYEVTEAGDVVVEAAGEGTDTVYSSISRYDLGANVENLTLAGSALTAVGNSLANTLIGNGLANLLAGGAGADLMIGGAGDDAYEVTEAGDMVVEAAGEGTDTVYSYISRYDLGANVEKLVLAGSALIGVGNGLANTLAGNTLDNLLAGGAGADMMVGGAGDDVYEVTEAGDLVVEVANQGTDTVYSYISRYDLTANVEKLVLAGAAVTGVGNALANTLIGNGLANLLAGGAGADLMIGGAGDDVYEVTEAGDVVVETAGEGTDTVYSAIGRYDLTANVEKLVLAGSAQIGVGNGLDNTLIGNAQANLLAGGAGGDVMIGGAGDDVYEVTEAGDQVVEGAGEGIDTVYSYIGAYALTANVENLTLAGSAVTGVGNALANSLIGNGQGNTLTGGDGADIFWCMSVGGGKDVITDFVDGVDRVGVAKALAADFASLQAHAAQVGADVVITYDQNTSLTLQQFSLANLSASDFLFS